MIIKDFLNLDFNKTEGKGTMPVAPENCTALGFLYGGAALATSVEVMEAVAERPAAWVTTQFVSFANSPGTLDLEANTSAKGRNISHCNMKAEVDGQVVFQALGSFGSRPAEVSIDWAKMPDVDKPEDCPKFLSLIHI